MLIDTARRPASRPINHDASAFSACAMSPINVRPNRSATTLC